MGCSQNLLFYWPTSHFSRGSPAGLLQTLRAEVQRLRALKAIYASLPHAGSEPFAAALAAGGGAAAEDWADAAGLTVPADRAHREHGCKHPIYPQTLLARAPPCEGLRSWSNRMRPGGSTGVPDMRAPVAADEQIPGGAAVFHAKK